VCAMWCCVIYAIGCAQIVVHVYHGGREGRVMICVGCTHLMNCTTAALVLRAELEAYCARKRAEL
jgi:hypothetical protein